MRAGQGRVAGLPWFQLTLFAAATALAAPAPGQPAAPPAEAREASAARPFEDVIRLFKAGLSEDFILRKIARDATAYRLSVDDIIACKTAGLPEPIIEAMLKTGPAPVTAPQAPPASGPVAAPAAIVAAPAATPPGPAGPVPAGAPAAAPVPQEPASPPPPAPPAAGAPPGPASGLVASWAGLVHRTGGVVLFRSPWSPGTLSFRDGLLSWTDAGDSTKSFEIPVTELREHYLVCPQETDFAGACWEWGAKAAASEHRFRDEGWERSESPKPGEIHAAVRAAFPALPEARYRAAKRK